MGPLLRKLLCLISLLGLVWMCEGSLRGLSIYRPSTSLKNRDASPGKHNPRAPVQNRIPFPSRLQTLPQALSKAPVTTQLPAQPPVGTVITPSDHVKSVGARCGEHVVQVEVKLDLFGTGQLVKPGDVSLGGCLSVGLDLSAQVLLFESELHTCGSVLTMTEDTLVYAFILSYTPTPEGASSIIRTNSAMVRIECQYLRKHNVSSDTLKPTWHPFSATLMSEDSLSFSLAFMTDDWMYERPSKVYFLGDMINIEVSVQLYRHVPLRVFVDSCVATLVPDTNSALRYDFIRNHGCLTDAIQTGSNSHFLDRTQPETLHLQLEAFRLQQQTSPDMYISCLLKATVATAPLDTEHKACSFAPGINTWVGADGDDAVCGCCETSCGQRKGRSLPSTDSEWEVDVMFGPIFIQETYVKGDQEVHAEEQDVQAQKQDVQAQKQEVHAEEQVQAQQEVHGEEPEVHVQQEVHAEVQAQAQSFHMLPDKQSNAGVSSESIAVAGVALVLGLLFVVVLATILYRRNQSIHGHVTPAPTDLPQ
ncbi:hypothetical protein DPEC_G00050190 [Dallia pectoralis]|uniref:Uncharacterized protein n=1 Tax=Dallia pectoralis TaxID=75939 RepID=A0ACC2HAV7_DALPE|nr:hypothetical protein DPEC_G00050190 [Dallia pectoralis]